MDAQLVGTPLNKINDLANCFHFWYHNWKVYRVFMFTAMSGYSLVYSVLY